METKEWAALASPEDRNAMEAKSFSRSGDSGALVVRKDPTEPVGLLWGARESLLRCLEPCYFTPISDVADHVFQVTGYRVRFPDV
jgi:hypothetical protein